MEEDFGEEAPGFEWDMTKSLANVQKHGLTFEVAAQVFADPLSVTIIDPWHSYGENRWVTMGLVQGKILVVAHTYPEHSRPDSIRLISARYATRAETRYYFNGGSYGQEG